MRRDGHTVHVVGEGEALEEVVEVVEHAAGTVATVVHVGEGES